MAAGEAARQGLRRAAAGAGEALDFGEVEAMGQRADVGHGGGSG